MLHLAITPVVSPKRHRGLSLIEVVLALAILGAAFAMLGQLIRIGGRHATEARELSMAHLYCQSVMGQIVAQALPASPAQNTPLPADAEWQYSVQVQNMSLDGLIAVQVTVHYAGDSDPRPVTASLTRWMIDPTWMQQREAEAAAEAAEQEAAQSEETSNAQQ